MANSTTSSGIHKFSSDYIEINIWLDSYNEMFSDFDPSPYSKRTISDDFISQVRKVVKDRYRKSMTLQLLLPQSNRNESDEKVVCQNLHNYFSFKNEQLSEDEKRSKRRGLLLTIGGTLSMLIGSYISFRASESFYSHLLLVLFEPAGWFMLWMGLDQLVSDPGGKRKELIFFRHMANAQIKFGTYAPDQ